MTFEGVCLGGPEHSKTFACQNDVIEMMHIDEGAVFAASTETLLPTTYRRGRYVHRAFRTTSGDLVGVWDWEGWSS